MSRCVHVLNVLIYFLSAPEGIATPTVLYVSNAFLFTWSPPTSPHGVITSYSLVLGGSEIFSGLSLSVTFVAEVQGEQSYYLEVFNSAGSTR